MGMKKESKKTVDIEEELKKYTLQGYEKIEKTPTSGGNSGRLYVSPDWIGHRVALIRLD
jgi:putative transposon-encoded protein